MDQQPGVATAWDAEYRGGRYRDEPPVAFTWDILAAARAAGHTAGLYIGCGNGRNYLPLVTGGLDLTGLDISAAAIAELAARAPERRHRLVHGDLGALPSPAAYPLVDGLSCGDSSDIRSYDLRARGKAYEIMDGSFGRFSVRVIAGRFRNGARW